MPLVSLYQSLCSVQNRKTKILPFLWSMRKKKINVSQPNAKHIWFPLTSLLCTPVTPPIDMGHFCCWHPHAHRGFFANLLMACLLTPLVCSIKAPGADTSDFTLHGAPACPVAQLLLGAVWKVSNAYDGL